MKDSQDDLEDDKARELLNKAVDRGFLITQDRSNLEEAIFVRYNKSFQTKGIQVINLVLFKNKNSKNSLYIVCGFH